ncbi:MAG: outer membrane lipoprotein-sorting protein [Pseudobdellovibrionaceae bacterium]
MKLMIVMAALFMTNTVSASAAKRLNPKTLIKRAEDQVLGKTFRGKLHMKIERPDSAREMQILSWTEGRDKALVKIVEPAKDQGTGNLRLSLDLWQYLPKVERLIKIPPSLMLQSWMGSDFTNDDLVRTSSTYRDYTHQFAGYETIEGVKTAKIICTPKPNAPVVWGKLEMWIDPVNAVTLRQDFYSEGGELLKSMTGSKIKKFGTHTIASRLEMKTVKKNTTTVIEYVDAHFDEKIDESIFNQNFLKASISNL